MFSNQSCWWKQLSSSCLQRFSVNQRVPRTACDCSNNQSWWSNNRRSRAGATPPPPPPCPNPCRKQGSRLLHYLSSDSLTALTLTNQPWVGLLFIYFLSWGLSRGLVWFWIQFTFHIYSEVWKESRKYQKLKFHFLELFLKEGSPTLSQLLGEGRFVQCWGRRAHHRTKLCGRVGNPGEESGKLQGTQRWSGVPPAFPTREGARTRSEFTKWPHIQALVLADFLPFLPSMFLERGVTSYPTSYSCLNRGPFGPQIHAGYLATWPLENQQMPLPAHQSLHQPPPPKLFCTALSSPSQHLIIKTARKHTCKAHPKPGSSRKLKGKTKGVTSFYSQFLFESGVRFHREESSQPWTDEPSWVSHSGQQNSVFENLPKGFSLTLKENYQDLNLKNCFDFTRT